MGMSIFVVWLLCVDLAGFVNACAYADFVKEGMDGKISPLGRGICFFVHCHHYNGQDPKVPPGFPGPMEGFGSCKTFGSQPHPYI